MASFLNSLESETKEQFVSVLSGGLEGIWIFAIAFAAFGCPIVILKKEYKLRDELNTEFGMIDKGRLITGPEAVSPVQKSSY